MAKAGFTGPVMSLGGVAGGYAGGAPVEYSDEIGPSLFWAGMAIPATGVASSKDRAGPGAIASVYCASPIRTVNTPCAAGGTGVTLTQAANAVAGTAMLNTTTWATGKAPGVPVTVGGVALTGVALDMGLDAATFATAGTVTLATAANYWRYRPGQWLCLLNCPANSTQMVQVVTAPSTGILTVNPAPAASTTGQIALTNRFNPNLYGATGAPSSVSSLMAAGSARIIIPEVGDSRGVGILGVTGGAPAGGTFTIQGIDGMGMPQSEIIPAPVGAATVWGKKTYDIFLSATPNFSDAHAYTVVLSDFIGLPLSVLSIDSIVAVNTVVISTGVATLAAPGTNYTIIPADLTNPATQLTGAPRGGIQVSGNGPATAPGTPLTLNPVTTLITVDQRLNPLQVAIASTINPGPLLGVLPV
jgi:hypothetical protein